jgi:hypothetical protein
MAHSPRTLERLIAAVQLLLIAPAAVFMGSLVLRAIQPQDHEPAHTAQRIVVWYAGRPWTLSLWLIALPLAVLTLGGVSLIRNWQADPRLRDASLRTLGAIRAHFWMLLIALISFAAACILAIVGVHVITD